MKLEFHTGLADKLTFACRLVRKAQLAGARMAVCGDAGTLDRLDTLLWTLDVDSFVPHVRAKRGAAPRPGWDRTPIWLVDDASAAPDRSLLINLGPALAAGWEGFERVIELVGDAPEDARAGRERWRAYEQAGHVALHHQREKATT